MNLQLKEFQEYCLKQHVAFVSYSLPGTNMPITFFSDASKVQEYNHMSDIEVKSGFILSPFQSEELPAIVISDKNKNIGWKIDLDEFPKSGINGNNHKSSVSQYSSTFQQYSKQIEEIKKSIIIRIRR